MFSVIFWVSCKNFPTTRCKPTDIQSFCLYSLSNVLSNDLFILIFASLRLSYSAFYFFDVSAIMSEMKIKHTPSPRIIEFPKKSLETTWKTRCSTPAHFRGRTPNYSHILVYSSLNPTQYCLWSRMIYKKTTFGQKLLENQWKKSGATKIWSYILTYNVNFS